MVRIKKLALSTLAAVAVAVGGLAVAAPAAPQTQPAFSWGVSNSGSFIDDEEIIEQVAGSKGDMAGAGRDSLIASSAEGKANLARESS